MKRPRVDSFNLGVAAEFIVAGNLIEMGYEVFLPFDRRGKVDLILYKNSQFIKAQVKRATWDKNKRKSNEYLRANCSSHGIKYQEQEIDVFIFIDPSHRIWMVPILELNNKMVVCLDKRVTTRGFSTKDKFDAETWRIK